MAKDPAFLFYPGDFTTGTQFFSDEQTGKYIRLLLAQHQHGHLSEEHMIFICKSYDKHIFSKFEQDSDKKYFNQRLETEIDKRKAFSLSRGKNREGKTKEKIISISYDNHMENKNRNKDILLTTTTKEVFENLKNELLQSDVWISDNARILKYSIETITAQLNKFINELLLKDDFYKPVNEYKRYFVNWIKKQQGIKDPSQPKMVY